MKKKVYAVKKGVNPGIYYNWDDCKKQVDGFKGAEYKSFVTEDEANEYLGISVNKENPVSEGYEIYVDGSYNSSSNEYGCGVIIIKDGEVLDVISDMGIDQEAAKMRNVAGEIQGAMLAMKYCVDNNIDTVKIYHDYVGIAAWCTGDWKAKNVFTQGYKKYYDEIRDRVNIEFVKVAAHMNNEFNEMADKAAKSLIFVD